LAQLFLIDGAGHTESHTDSGAAHNDDQDNTFATQPLGLED